MKIAVLGATGHVGSPIVAEALRRSHSVTGIVREPWRHEGRQHLLFIKGDANEPQEIAPLLAEHDVVVSAVPFRNSRPALLIDAVRRSRVKRYLVVGGAGSLQIADGTLLVDSPDFPEFVREEATGGKVFLDVLRTVDDLDWTMLSPSALITSGDRTGTFRLGEDTLLTSAAGKSWISYDDYAIALIDEIESPRHVRRRFTVGY